MVHDIFCFTDIHGKYDLYKAIMDYCNEQDPEATIVFLGDACDRGPDGYRIMKELLDNPNVLYLKGNHEDMFVKAAREIKEIFIFKDADKEEIHNRLNSCKHFDYKYASIQDSLYNGGLVTLTDWILDGMPMDIVKRIEQLPLTFTYNDMDFCHSSCVYQTFKRVNDAEYENIEPDQWDVTSILWSRTALGMGWAPNRFHIFGHTPVQYLSDYIDNFNEPENCNKPVMYSGDMWYSNMTGKRLDMDTGAASTGVTYVLNILTMEAQGFELKDNEVKKIEVIQF